MDAMIIGIEQRADYCDHQRGRPAFTSARAHGRVHDPAKDGYIRAYDRGVFGTFGIAHMSI